MHLVADLRTELLGGDSHTGKLRFGRFSGRQRAVSGAEAQCKREALRTLVNALAAVVVNQTR